MSISTREQYEILASLREVDGKVLRLTRGLAEIPLELEKLEKALGARRTALSQTQESFDKAKKRLKDAELELREREGKLEKAETKMMEVKTNTEYQAALKENEQQKSEMKLIEEDILSLLGNVEELKSKVQEDETAFHAIEKTFGEDRERLLSEQKKLSALLADEEAHKKQYVHKLSPEIAIMYSRLSRSGLIAAISLVESGMCQGCRIKLRPQLYNEILGMKTIHRCSNCGRIVIIRPEEYSAKPEENLAE